MGTTNGFLDHRAEATSQRIKPSSPPIHMIDFMNLRFQLLGLSDSQTVWNLNFGNFAHLKQWQEAKILIVLFEFVLLWITYNFQEKPWTITFPKLYFSSWDRWRENREVGAVRKKKRVWRAGRESGKLGGREKGIRTFWVGTINVSPSSGLLGLWKYLPLNIFPQWGHF